MGWPFGGVGLAAGWPALAGAAVACRRKPPAASRQSPSCRRPFLQATKTPTRQTNRATNPPANQPTHLRTDSVESAEPIESSRLALPIESINAFHFGSIFLLNEKAGRLTNVIEVLAWKEKGNAFYFYPFSLLKAQREKIKSKENGLWSFWSNFNVNL